MKTATRRRPGSGNTPRADVAAIVDGLRRIVRALELYSQEVRRAYGLTGPQLWALKTLQRRGAVTVNELAAALAVHQSSASILVNRLEQRGLIRRSRGQQDRRFVRIEPTEKALSLMAEAPEPAQGRLLHGLSTMSPTRIRGIRKSVDDLVGAMEAKDIEAQFFFEDS